MTTNLKMPTMAEFLTHTWVEPQPPVLRDLGWTALQCPAPDCSEGGLHLDLTGLIAWPDYDEYHSPAGTRGEFLLIPMECERCGKKSALSLGNHKGEMVLHQLRYTDRTAAWAAVNPRVTASGERPA